MKYCSCCKAEKDDSEFHKDSKAKDGLSYHCKPCAIARSKKNHADNRDARVARMREKYDPEKNRIQCKKYREENRESVKTAIKKWRDAHPNHSKERYARDRDRILARQKLYHQKHSKKKLDFAKAYRENPANRERISKQKTAWYLNKRRTDIGFRILCNLRRRLYDFVKGKSKSARTIEIVGCSIDGLKLHIQKQWKPGMTWENYGKWEIDHIIPCASFSNLELLDQQRQCFGFENLQPLWRHENNAKSDSMPTPACTSPESSPSSSGQACAPVA